MHRVIVWFKGIADPEEFETPDAVALQGPVMMISDGAGGHTAIPFDAIRKWRVQASKLTLAKQAHNAVGLKQ